MRRWISWVRPLNPAAFGLAWCTGEGGARGSMPRR